MIPSNTPPPKNGVQYHSGWDYFTPRSGTEEVMFCRACGERMDVKRDFNGPTSYAEAVAKKSHLHDRFTCPNSGEAWHDQVIELKEEYNKSKSPEIRKLIAGDVLNILHHKKVRPLPKDY